MLLALIGLAIASTPCEVSIYSYDASVPASYSDTYALALSDAIEAWNSVDSSIALKYAGKTQNDKMQGAIVVSWSNDHGNNPSSVADTYTIETTAGISRARVLIMTDQKWCHVINRDDCYDLRRVLTHELGHAVGIDHGPHDSMMSTYTSPDDDSLKILTAADVKLLQEIHPPGTNTCAGKNPVIAW